LFTHCHDDRVHGMDELRAIAPGMTPPLPMYGDSRTLASLQQRFSYIFDETIKPIPGTSKPEGRAYEIEAGRAFPVGDVEVLPLAVPHGPTPVLAFRIGGLAYVTDAKSVPPAVVEQLRGARVLVLNALFRRPHPTHLSIPEAV